MDEPSVARRHEHQALAPRRRAFPEALADAAGLDRTYISALERSRYAVTVDVLERLALALEIDASELLRLPR